MWQRRLCLLCQSPLHQNPPRQLPLLQLRQKRHRRLLIVGLELRVEKTLHRKMLVVETRQVAKLVAALISIRHGAKILWKVRRWWKVTPAIIVRFVVGCVFVGAKVVSKRGVRETCPVAATTIAIFAVAMDVAMATRMAMAATLKAATARDDWPSRDATTVVTVVIAMAETVMAATATIATL